MRTKASVISPILLLLAVVGCGSRNREIRATGTVELLETDVAANVSGRLTALRVDEGGTVHAGDTVATLVSTTLPSELGAREAEVARAAAELTDLERGARPEEIARAESELRAANAERERAAQDLERARPLAGDGTISAQQFDAYRSAAIQTSGRRDAFAESLRLLRAGARADAVSAARARLETARAQLDVVRLSSAELTLVAPSSGTVLRRYAEVGELVGPYEPVMTLGDAARPWVRVYVNQRDLPRLKPGASAEAWLDGIPERRFAGRIAAINPKAEFTPRVALTEDEREDMLFGIKVDLRDASGRLEAGLPVTVEFITHDSAVAHRVASRGRP